jgi:hypothetical protein
MSVASSGATSATAACATAAAFCADRYTVTDAVPMQ